MITYGSERVSNKAVTLHCNARNPIAYYSAYFYPKNRLNLKPFFVRFIYFKKL